MSHYPSRVRWLQARIFTGAATGQTPTAGRVYLLQVNVPVDCVVDAVSICNLAAVAGNVTVGLYGPVTTDTCAAAVLVASSASTAVSGTNTSQTVSFSASATVKKGDYYIAVEYSDGSTMSFNRMANQTHFLGWTQYYDRGGGYGALTDPCPAVTNSGSGVPAAIALRVTGGA